MKKWHILIVDDQVEIINSLKRVLRDDEYRISEALDAVRATEIITVEKVDLIICDYKLGGANGMELLQKVSSSHPETITILITAHPDLNMAIEAINKGSIYKFIIKPWDNEDMRVTVKRALQHKGLITRNRELLNEIRKRDAMLDQIEKEYPGLMSLKRDGNGNIVIEVEEEKHD
ncbi:MAG: response regulator [Candidatus Omnitrophica bacterium]|nr:response regulator [Candidatus Omnitrophota bacterium]